MRASDLRRPRFYIPIGLALLLSFVSTVVFHPAFQKKMLLDQVGPMVDSLEIEHIHLTPWSLTLKNLSVGYQGGQFGIRQGLFRYSLSSLLWRTLNINAIKLDDVFINLESFHTPKTEVPRDSIPPGIFPGVLASLEHGLGYTLNELMIDADVRLPGRQSVTARVEGGGINPGDSGAIRVAVRFHTGQENDYVDLVGEVTLDQLTRGRFAAVETVLDIQAVLANLPEPERVNLNFAAAPSPLSGTGPDTTHAAAPHLPPETWQLRLFQKDSTGRNRSALELKGAYNGNTGGFEGGYWVTANERLVQPYLKEIMVPPSKETLTGELRFNVATLTGDITVLSNLLVTNIQESQGNEQLPELLRLKNNFRLSLLPGNQLRIETLETGVSDEADNRPLASHLPADLNIPLGDIDGFLQQEQTLLEFQLPRVPMKWLDVFLSGQKITDGHLTAAFRITTDRNSTIHLVPVKPLMITGLTMMQENRTLFDGLNLSVLPGASYSGKALRASLDHLVVDGGRGPLTTGDFKAVLGLAEEHKGTIKVRSKAELNTKNLIDFLAIQQTRRQTTPEHFSFDFQTTVRQKPGIVVLDTLEANLSYGPGMRLVNLQLLQPLTMKTGEAGTTFRNTDGRLAALTINDLLLEWFSPYVPNMTLKGKLHRAEFSLAADGRGTATMTTDRPFMINHLTVVGKDGPLLEDLDLSARPEIRLAPQGTDIAYQDFSLASGQTSLISGNGKVTLPGAADQPLMAEGRLDADLQALSRQPLITKVLQAEIAAPVRLEANYQLAQGKSNLDISSLSINLFYGEHGPKMTLEADSGLRIPTQLSPQLATLGRGRGRMTLTVANLTPEPFAEILAAKGLSFAAGTGKAVFVSDGESLRVDTLEPFVITGIEVKPDDSALLHPFTVTAIAETTVQGETLSAKLNRFSLDFDQDQAASALDGTAGLTLKAHDEAVKVEALDADLTAVLPVLLEQPAILPHHNLEGGDMNLTLKVRSDGHLDSTIRIHGLQGKEELPLQQVAMTADGQLDPNGDFEISAPLTIAGKSGKSDIRVQATHSTKDHDNNDVAIAVDSSVFYLNDLLATLAHISGESPSETSGKNDKPAEADKITENSREVSDQRPDERAFWDRTAFDAQLDFNMDRLFYTEYLEFQHIKGRAEFLAERLALKGFEAHFHDSPLKADGEMTFTPGPMPYDAELKADVEQFDLAKFFRELTPDSKPRAEGLFDFNLEAFGQSPNLAQYRNHLFFDMHLVSRDGLFRLLDPDSPLVSASSNFAGGVGEVVSYIPTGLFGLGAVSRLVNYIKDIKYDKIDVHIVRDQSRDVQIKSYVVQSPEILLTAEGGIEYREGVDIFRSPLSMDARLNLRDRGAAIMYNLDLLEDEQDSYGYWKGPRIKFTGTLGRTESNLADVISTAGNGALLGGITRPISGLIGNIKYQWFGEDKKPAEYQLEK